MLQSGLNSLIEVEVIRSLQDPALLDDADYHTRLNEILILAQSIATLRYLNPRSVGSAGRLSIHDAITEFLNFPEDGFLVNFRMLPERFWALVEMLEARGGGDYWHTHPLSAAGGSSGRPVYQQVAIALYILGSAGASFEKIRMKFNIGKGTTQVYLWRTVNLLAVLAPEYVQWPTVDVRRQQRRQQIDDAFNNCVGYVTGYSRCGLRAMYALITLNRIGEGRTHKNLLNPRQAFLFLFPSPAIPFCKL